MRRPLITALLGGLVLLGASGTAVAAEGAHPHGLNKLLSATLLDVSPNDGESHDGTVHTSTSSPDGSEPQAKPQPKPQPQTKPQPQAENQPQE
ncbi:hypothetical protein AB0L13_18745 [Saccharopolyspora shandongensis]|uniref:hypothetical protein n=1 Tax=Saccharopolyspora shandongensis TaxID=418495 RepID=UPI00342B5B94